MGLFSKKYYESENLGDRYSTLDAANAYWHTRMFNPSRVHPFTMYFMPSIEDGWEALAKLPYLHTASDSNQLIADRMVSYGCYAYECDGKKYIEAFVSGDDLTDDEIAFAEQAFIEFGGNKKNTDTSRSHPLIHRKPGKASQVKFKCNENGNGRVYEVYSAPSRAAAEDFLKKHPVNKRLYYIVVETPEGNFGRDIDGCFRED